jgi:hypothetical protein
MNGYYVLVYILSFVDRVDMFLETKDDRNRSGRVPERAI